MVDLLYLYQKPFTINDNMSNRDSYIIDHFDDNDRLDEKKLHSLLLRFAFNEDLLRVQDSETITTSRQNDMGSWIWAINWMNFRSLVDPNQYSKLMMSLQSLDNHPANQIIDLHVRLGSLFSEKLLNTLCNRVLSSLEIVPYNVEGDAKQWKDIHTEAPYIWIIVLLQVIIRSEMKKDI